MFAEEFTADRRRLRSVWNPREGTLDVPRCGRSRLGIRRADAYFNTSDFEGFSGLNDNVRQLDVGSQVLRVFTGISFSGYPRTTVDYSAQGIVRNEWVAESVRQMVRSVEPKGEF